MQAPSLIPIPSFNIGGGSGNKTSKRLELCATQPCRSKLVCSSAAILWFNTTKLDIQVPCSYAYRKTMWHSC